jgi:hypothetical protein
MCSQFAFCQNSFSGSVFFCFVIEQSAKTIQNLHRLKNKKISSFQRNCRWKNYIVMAMRGIVIGAAASAVGLGTIVS